MMIMIMMMMIMMIMIMMIIIMMVVFSCSTNFTIYLIKVAKYAASRKKLPFLRWIQIVILGGDRNIKELVFTLA